MISLNEALLSQGPSSPHFSRLSALEAPFAQIVENYLSCNTELRKQAANPRSIFLDPAVMQDAVSLYHQINGLPWSFGGYLEDCSQVFRGYSDQGTILNAGVAVNVPHGTEVRLPFEGKIVKIDQNRRAHDLGSSIIVQPANKSLLKGVVLYAHLQNIQVEEGSIIPEGAVIAEVGRPPWNGNWWEHLHVQAIAADAVRVHGKRLIDAVKIFISTDNHNVMSDYPNPIRFMPTSWEV